MKKTKIIKKKGFLKKIKEKSPNVWEMQGYAKLVTND